MREDVVFNIVCLLTASGAVVIPDRLYRHRPRPGSLTTSYRANKHDELARADARLRAFTQPLHTPRLASLLNYLSIRSLISAGLNLHHQDSTVSEAESDSLMHEWQASAGPLPVGGWDPTLRGTSLLYRLLGLRRLTRMAKRVKALKRRVRPSLFRNRRPGV